MLTHTYIYAEAHRAVAALRDIKALASSSSAARRLPEFLEIRFVRVFKLYV